MIPSSLIAQPIATSGARTIFAQREETVRRLILLTALYAIAGSPTLLSVLDPDIWWHLRTGRWIVEHGTVPMTDSFSAFGAGKPWVAYSWLFEVLVYGLYRAFGLVSVVAYTIIFSLIITMALHALVRKHSLSFPAEIAITALGLIAIKPLLSPRPWLFTILFFILELDILLAARQSGDVCRLLLLPPLFLLWANTHIQFIYGLFVLGLATAEPIIDRVWRHSRHGSTIQRLPFRHLLLATIACCGVTLITPYHFHLYQTIIELVMQSGPFEFVSELRALSFRTPWHWFVLGAALGAAFSLGRAREIQTFPLLLFVTGALLSFRAARDAWFVVVVSIAIIAASCSALKEKEMDRFALTRFRSLVVAGLVFVAVVIFARVRNISESSLESVVGEKYPVAATAVVEERGYTGPLYNHFNWGGYLIWRLPNFPVAMDGRTNVYGDERIRRNLDTWAGGREWASDTELGSARLVIAGMNYPLTSLLRFDSRFELVYEDKIAAVFVARSQQEEQEVAKVQPQ